MGTDHPDGRGLASTSLISASPEITWDDLRAFLAVAVHGSMSRAGTALRESQPTIARRIKRLEEGLCFQVLRRGPNSAVLTEAGSALVRAVSPMAEAAHEIEAVARVFRPRSDLPVSITATTTMSMFLSRQLPVLRAACVPRDIILLPSRRAYDIAGGEADIALRMRSVPSNPELLVQKVGLVAFAAYGISDEPTLPMIMPADDRSVSKNLAAARKIAVLRSAGPQIDQLHLRLQAIKSGVGIGLLPCWIGDADPDLVRVHDDLALAVHDEMYLIRSMRSKADKVISAVAKAVVTVLRKNRAILAGQPQPQRP